jgi:hypothetical protein
MHKQAMAIIAATCALGAVALQTATAEAHEGPIWEIGGSEVSGSSVIKSKSVGGITVEDLGAPGEPKIECKETDEGSVGIFGRGEVTKATMAECKILKGPCTSIGTVTALHLPWATQLENVEGKFRDMTADNGSGAPGLGFDCSTILGLIEDQCTGEITSATENVTGGVNLVFDSKSEHGNCSIGGAGAGVISGTDLYEHPSEKSLTVGGTGGGLRVPLTISFPGGPTTQTDTIRNVRAAGGGVINLVEIKMTGGDATQFDVKEEKMGTCASLKEGDSCRIEITFIAGAKGKFASQIEYLAFTGGGGPYFSDVTGTR